MKIKAIQTLSLKLTDMIDSKYKLDPVTINIENIEDGKGKITVDCYGQSWSAYWGAMGANTNVQQFVASCGADYIIGCMTSMYSEIADYEGLAAVVKKNIIQERRWRSVSKEAAREAFDSVPDFEDEASCHFEDAFLSKWIGDEWWHEIPQKPNPDYEYLERIINAVKDGLKAYMAGESEVAA